jgi:hypothetical protein
MIGSARAILIVATFAGCGGAGNKWVAQDLDQFEKAFDNSLIIYSTDLPVAWVGEEYDFTLDARGSPNPFLWRIVSGQLPSGMQLAGDGAFHGTPTTPEVATFVVKVRCKSSSQLSVRGGSPHVGWRMRQFTLVVKERMSASSSSPPSGPKPGSARSQR